LWTFQRGRQRGTSGAAAARRTGRPRIAASDVRRAARPGFRHHQGPARSSRIRQSPDRSSSAREAAQDWVDMCCVPISALTTAGSTDSAIRRSAGGLAYYIP
jgi:hypothetical protein